MHDQAKTVTTAIQANMKNPYKMIRCDGCGVPEGTPHNTWCSKSATGAVLAELTRDEHADVIAARKLSVSPTVSEVLANDLRAGYANDPVNHPTHYTSHPSGVECIAITEHMNFNVGNAVKYLWRAGLKGITVGEELQDLQKAQWYINREIERLGHGN